MQQSAGEAAFFFIAKDRVVPDYSSVSKTQPIVARLSLAQPPAGATRGEALDIDALIDSLLSSRADSASRNEAEHDESEKIWGTESITWRRSVTPI
jgi:hypothetical protein